jgi:hypothetical protein
MVFLPAASLSLFSQVEGESEVTTVILRKRSDKTSGASQVSVQPGVQHVPSLHGVNQVPFIPEATEVPVALSGPTYEVKNHALIIGIDHYADPAITDLDNPVADANELFNTLTSRYTFEPGNVIFLKDPGRAEIIDALDRLSASLTRNDNLLVFYAGHGYWDAEKESGFWLPSDAAKNSTANWIRNSTIQDFVDDIDTQHTLLVTDACFAGSIFKTRGGFSDASVAVNKLYSLPSRKAMTSGTLEQVPDRSVFLEYLLKRLEAFEGRYLTSGDLFNSFRDAVLNNSPNVPQYGVIQNTGDEGGEYIFIRR